MFLLSETRGHASVGDELLTHLQTVALAVNQNPQILNTFVCVIQTLITILGVRGRFLEWARREGNSHPSTGCRQPADPSTVERDKLWSYNSWTIVLGIVNRFWSQPVPLAEPLFLASLGDVLTAMDGEQ